MLRGVDIVFNLAPWCLLTTATLTDILFGKIFNLLTIPFFFAGILVRFLCVGSDSGLEAVHAVIFALVLFFPLYLARAIAAGDVKLLMALAAWGNATMVLRCAVLSILLGALVGGILLLLRRLKPSSGQRRLRALTHMPFAPAFFCAFMLLQLFEMKGWAIF